MTEEEFKAMLAVDGLRARVIFRPGTPDVYIARVVQPIHPDDVNEGPYRYEGMTRTILEVSSEESINAALNLLIDAYLQGGHKL